MALGALSSVASDALSGVALGALSGGACDYAVLDYRHYHGVAFGALSGVASDALSGVAFGALSGGAWKESFQFLVESHIDLAGVAVALEIGRAFSWCRPVESSYLVGELWPLATGLGK